MALKPVTQVGVHIMREDYVAAGFLNGLPEIPKVHAEPAIELEAKSRHCAVFTEPGSPEAIGVQVAKHLVARVQRQFWIDEDQGKLERGHLSQADTHVARGLVDPLFQSGADFGLERRNRNVEQQVLVGPAFVVGCFAERMMPIVDVAQPDAGV